MTFLPNHRGEEEASPFLGGLKPWEGYPETERYIELSNTEGL